MSNDFDILTALHQQAAPLRDLLADPGRFASFSLEACGILADLSHTALTGESRAALLALAEARNLRGQIDTMFAGGIVNKSENRAALHTALRAPADSHGGQGGEIAAAVQATLAQMKELAETVRAGRWEGATGQKITDFVQIGIGGSHLGPEMVCKALRHLSDGAVNVHFLANVDGHEWAALQRKLSPETTLFAVVSKTFTTQETLMNAQAALAWLERTIPGAGDPAVALAIRARHFVAATANRDEAMAFGILPRHILPFREWVGGRFSLWTAPGIAIPVCIGFDQFEALLRGAHAMDTHFRTAPFAENLPVMLALCDVWHRNGCGYPALAILGYDFRLDALVSHLQQLMMESNGKGVTADGESLNWDSIAVIFGQTGTNVQHAFMQHLHQSPAVTPAEFIGVVNPDHDLRAQHDALLANMLAQADALAYGRAASESGGDPARAYSGNRPSTTLLIDRLDAEHLGALIALYEHRVFAEAVIWRINAFDQWGVELGKAMSKDALKTLQAAQPGTESLAGYIARRQGNG